MAKNRTVKDILNNQKLSINKMHLNYLEMYSRHYEMPKNLLLGIYLIEDNFRPFHYRLGEYLLTIMGALLNMAFKRPLKNYTIGVCQIGVSTILKFHGKNTYKHVRYIDKIDNTDFINIVKAMHYKKNIEICAEMVNDFYKKSLIISSNYNLQLRYIGEEYNGQYSYGLLLEDIVNLLDNNYFDI